MRRYVRRQRAKVVKLPRDRWRGRTFVEHTGDAYEVIWAGHRDAPLLCAPIDRGNPNAEARLHLRSRA
jgi:hypothetical protein